MGAKTSLPLAESITSLGMLSSCPQGHNLLFGPVVTNRCEIINYIRSKTVSSLEEKHEVIQQF